MITAEIKLFLALHAVFGSGYESANQPQCDIQRFETKKNLCLPSNKNVHPICSRWFWLHWFLRILIFSSAEAEVMNAIQNWPLSTAQVTNE
jgi:hypothetical protein